MTQSLNTINLANIKCNTTPKMIDDMLTQCDEQNARRSARSAKRIEKQNVRDKRYAIIILIIAIMFVFGIIIGEAFAYNAKVASIRALPTEIVTVANGDCLESIASDCGIDGISMTYLADEIEKMNEDTLVETNGVLYPGMKLRVPVSNA